MTTSTDKITPHLWFDKEAWEAAELYCSVFPNSQVTNITTLHNTPSGDCDVVSFALAGQPFMAISAGPLFKFNPAISFIVNFDPARDKNARKNLDATWAKLSEGGTVLMPLDKYPFSERYGWIQDKYGVSWQIIHSNPEGEQRPFIVPSLMFAGSVCGKAEEAIEFYQSVFKNSRQGRLARYPQGMKPDKEGTIMFADFTLENQWFAAMDSARKHNFSFNEAISFIIRCTTQEEIDSYWENFPPTRKPNNVAGARINSAFRQVQPTMLNEIMNNGTSEQIDCVTQAFLPMKKFDIAALKRAYEGK